MEDGQNFAISKKVEGKLFKNLSDSEFDEALPNLFGILQCIHSIDVPNKEGYGKWNEDGVADKKTWKEFLINVDEFAKHMFENSILEKEVWDFIYARFIKLIPFCPEEKYLVHGDYGFDNLLVKDGKVTGVIDWEHSMYGDFLYDVAWLQFFSKNIAFEKVYLDFLKKTRKDINNFDERMLCYKLYIGLGSLSFYAYSQQADKYELCKSKLLELIKE